MRKNTVLFDLDGTLTDPALGITNSVMYALDRFGIRISDRGALYPFIGPPLTESFEKYFDFSPAQARHAVEIYREYFSRKGIFENTVYEGVPELLEGLKADGRRLLLATSKPAVFAERILDHFGLEVYFDFLSGSELDGRRIKKNEVIDHALEACGITDRSGCIMVGDRENDILGAKLTGIASVGVLYGYGSREELQTAGADWLAGSVAELRGFFEGGAL